MSTSRSSTCIIESIIIALGHAIIYVGDGCKDLEACLRMDGLIKCSIVPPERLYKSVLTFRCNKKVIFCLCRTCVLSSSSSSTAECVHTRDDYRALTGTWVMDEVRLTVQRGYRILDLYEDYEYQLTQRNPETGEGLLFTECINMF